MIRIYVQVKVLQNTLRNKNENETKLLCLTSQLRCPLSQRNMIACYSTRLFVINPTPSSVQRCELENQEQEAKTNFCSTELRFEYFSNINLQYRVASILGTHSQIR